jgi:hypothetical protein
MTIDDANVHQAVLVHRGQRLKPDDELIEFVCAARTTCRPHA